MPDRPRLVEAVDVGAVLVGVAALLGVAAHPDVAVGDGEQRLGDAEVAAVGVALDEPPRVDGEAAAVERVGRRRGEAFTRAPRGRVTTSPAAGRGEHLGPGPAVDADDEAEVAGGTGPHARHGVLDDDRAVRGWCRTAVAAWTKVSGAGLPASPSAVATRPSTTVTNRSASPAASSTAGALADDETTASGIPIVAQRVEQGDRARVRARRRRGRGRR